MKSLSKFFSTYLYLRVPLIACALYSGLAFANETADDCYEAKDKSCLEGMYRDILIKPTDEKIDAVYFLGLIFLEEENYEEAKKQFQMGSLFGDGERSGIKFKEVMASGKIKIKAVDCLLGTKDEDCFLNVAKSNPEEADAAYYLLGNMTSKTDPERAAEFTIKAAELGHKTAACQLGAGYAQEPLTGATTTSGHLPKLPVDFEQSRKWYKECSDGPFPGFSEESFQKYLDAQGPKAYVKSGSYGFYASAMATSALAAQLAYAVCNSNPKIESRKDCLIVSVDGEWVDYFKAESLPNPVGGLDDLLRANARKAYAKYEKENSPKVFVQGRLGNWSSETGNSDESIDELTRIAVESCQDTWLYTKYDSACNVVNLNGEWIK